MRNLKHVKIQNQNDVSADHNHISKAMVVTRIYDDFQTVIQLSYNHFLNVNITIFTCMREKTEILVELLHGTVRDHMKNSLFCKTNMDLWSQFFQAVYYHYIRK